MIGLKLTTYWPPPWGIFLFPLTSYWLGFDQSQLSKQQTSVCHDAGGRKFCLWQFVDARISWFSALNFAPKWVKVARLFSRAWMVPLKGEICWVLRVIAFQLARTHWLTTLNLLIAYVEIWVPCDRKVLSLRCFLGDYFPRGSFCTFITTVQQICSVKSNNLRTVSCKIWWKSKRSCRLCYDWVCPV